MNGIRVSVDAVDEFVNALDLSVHTETSLQGTEKRVSGKSVG